jgi:hypothetical protein
MHKIWDAAFYAQTMGEYARCYFIALGLTGRLPTYPRRGRTPPTIKMVGLIGLAGTPSDHVRP